MLAGDERSFEEFFDRYFPGLFRFALARMERDPADAEEVAQATLCRAISKLATYRGEATLFTWLCTFCRHEISAFYRKRRRRPPVLQLAEDVPEIGAALASLAAAEAAGPEEWIRRREIARLVRTTLDLLPGRYGDALEWKYIDGHSVGEIAARLGVGYKAAESLLTRARRAFREGFLTLKAGAGPAIAGPGKAPV